MKKLQKKFNIVFALVLAILLSGQLTVSVQAADITLVSEDTIKIKDVEDLLEFAENCALDSWSQDKTVVLQADIFLEGEEFLPIPTFGGTFDGKGHSISGLDIDSSVSPAGLFGVVQEGAVVKNINVSGNVEPTGINSAVGGVVGENYGDIINCSFTGTVAGEEHIGGIVGINGAAGTIQNCRVSGTVLGESMTGGISGYNLGTITKCKNDADVNNVSVDPSISLDDLNVDISMDMTEINSKNLLGIASDSGGIAGYSTGVIEGCTNVGTIGYPHIGYNLGGIAGRSCGYVTDCTNNGEVYGRKDVGGIVGQMEPYIDIKLSESGIAAIGQDVNALSSAVENLENNADAGSLTLQKRVQRIRTYLGEIETTLRDTAQDPLNSNPIPELQAEVNILTKQLELLTKEAAGGVGTLGKDITNIVSQAESFSATFQSVMQEAENLALSDFVADISDVNLEDATLGKVTKSINGGKVYGDINVGGIAGTISMEYELDPEDDLTADFSMKERRRYELTSIIYKCENTAIVSAKKNYVGGICGRMDLGLITDCEGYGTIYSESGDYVGGIAGMTGSTVQNSFAKCSLSGKNYVGGIVGSGTTEDATGESSTVRWCYSLVDVTGAQQFFGAIAGANAGDYLECYFVSDELPGINRTSYVEMAEPITYDELLDVAGLPEEFETFTLTFVADEEVVYAATFEYGESFDEDVFPELPGGEAGNMQWDTAELKNLKKDTVVRAVYSQYLSTLASADVREDGRAVFLAEGQFGEEDTFTTVQKDVDFALEDEQGLLDKLNKTVVLEQWSVELPEDGLLIHTLRYLPQEPENENVTLYVKQDGKWKLAEREAMGSYLLVNIAGTNAEVAVVETTEMWGIWLAAIVVIVGVIGGVIWMIRKKKSILKWFVWVLAAVIAVLVIALIVVLLNGKLTSGVEAYQLLKEYVEQPEMTMKLHVDAEIGDSQTDVEANVLCTDLEGHQVTCIEQSGVSFFYADGILFLENGKAYRASEVSADYAELLDYTVMLYQDVDIETLKEEDSKTYRVTVKEESREKLLAYLLPDAEEGSLEIANLQVDVLENEETLESITFTAQGRLQGEDKKDFDISATLEVTDNEEVKIEIPEVVKNAILSDNTQVEDIITEDIFRLYAGWKDLYGRDPLGMQIYLNADCGPLTLSEDLTFITKMQDDLRVNCVKKNDFAVYFTEDKICSENGYSVTTKRAESTAPAMLLGLAYELCLNGTFSCTEVNDTYIYSLALDEADMEEVAKAIAKESADMPIQFENGSIQVRIQDSEVESIRFACDGNVDILVTNVAVAFSAELDVTGAEKYESFTIPEKVIDALKK